MIRGHSLATEESKEEWAALQETLSSVATIRERDFRKFFLQPNDKRE